MLMKNIIKVSGIKKNYGNISVLKDVSFEIEEGKIYGFVGPNGAGKTTTFKVLLGMTSRNGGSIISNGKEFEDLFSAYEGKVGAIVNSPAFYGELTAKENMYIIATLKNVDKSEIDRILEAVGLDRVGKLKCKKYSMGMKQRLAIAGALLGKPKLLLLDEPINGLDPQGIYEIRLILKKLKEEYGTTIMISSHLLSELELVCDEYIVISRGNIKFTGNADELKTQTKSNNLEEGYFKLMEVNDIYA